MTSFSSILCRTLGAGWFGGSFVWSCGAGDGYDDHACAIG